MNEISYISGIDWINKSKISFDSNYVKKDISFSIEDFFLKEFSGQGSIPTSNLQKKSWGEVEEFTQDELLEMEDEFTQDKLLEMEDEFTQDELLEMEDEFSQELFGICPARLGEAYQAKVPILVRNYGNCMGRFKENWWASLRDLSEYKVTDPGIGDCLNRYGLRDFARNIGNRVMQRKGCFMNLALIEGIGEQSMTLSSDENYSRQFSGGEIRGGLDPVWSDYEDVQGRKTGSDREEETRDSGKEKSLRICLF